jgi:alkylation response protein AidB-like acyl-CoA dehydrogenase
LRTRAVLEGDHYLVSGQKIWSSCAQYARFCLLLARTDPGAVKHEGISYFILDLASPGVTLRPIRMLTGESHFCEIFLDNVPIPAANLIGAENKGWLAAQAPLAMATPPAPRALDDDELRRRLVDIHTRLEALRLLVNDMLSRVLRRGQRGVEPSIIKVYYSELLKDFTELGVQIGGMDAQYLQPILMGGGYETGYWMHDHLYSWSWTIAGGSNEVQRNIIAERGLGLPREPSLKQGSTR